MQICMEYAFDRLKRIIANKIKLNRQVRWERMIYISQVKSFAERSLLSDSNDCEYHYTFAEVAHDMYEEIFGEFEWAH